jgi:hypothetical protein
MHKSTAIEHSKEPWSVYNNGIYIEFQDSSMEKIGDVCASQFLINEAASDKSNARRIVACVNACKNISTENLENSANFVDAINAPLRMLEAVKAENDKLLAELKNIAECDMSKWAAEFKNPADFKLWAQNRARLAIANAEAA